jgi:hypothetical protein
MSSSFVRRARPLFLLGVAIACSSGGSTEPAARIGSLQRQAAVAGTWVYQYEDLRSEPMLAGGPIVADSLHLSANLVGRWALTWIDPVDRATRRSGAISLVWAVARDTLFVTPTCEPRELCDPIPGWYGTFAPDGRLVLLPSFRAQQVIAPRVYERVRP